MNAQRTPSWRAAAPWILMAAGLAATAVELALFGAEDVTGALTYAGRISGVVFLTAAALEVVALGSLLNLPQPRPATYSGAFVILGVLIALLTNVVLLILHLDGSFTPYALFLVLLPWSCWALLRLYRAGVFRHVPHAKGFAAGVVLAGILAVANFTHAQVYQPYTATAMLTTSVDFGPATALTPDGAVSVPVRLRTRNTGKVGVYVLGSLYQVSGRQHSYVDKPRPDTDWLQDLNSRQRDLMRYTDVIPGRYELLSQGQFIGRSGPAAMVLDPGADVVTERVVQFPKEKSYEVLAATANIVFLRKDRAKLLDDYAASGASSWTKEFRHGSTNKAPEWVTHSAPVNTFRHQSRIAHSTAVLENTRAPHYVTVWWALHTPTSEIPFAPDLVAVVGTKEDLNHAPTATQRHRMTERYGLAYAPSGSIHRSLPALLKTP